MEEAKANIRGFPGADADWFWRKKMDDPVSPSMWITDEGMLSIFLGGHTIVALIEDWHRVMWDSRNGLKEPTNRR